MRAIVLNGHGGPEVLTFADIAAPQPGPEEIVVQVRATSLNRADLLQRMGFYPDPFPGEHEVPGMEFSGSVQALGSRVRSWRVGDEVMGIGGHDHPDVCAEIAHSAHELRCLVRGDAAAHTQ